MGKSWFNLLGLLSLWGLIGAIIWDGNITKNSKHKQIEPAQIEQIVHDYLLKNPRVIIEMEDRLRLQERAEEEAAIRKTKEAMAKEFNHMLIAPGELLKTSRQQPTKDYILWYFTQPKCPSCHRADHLVQEVVTAHPELEQRIFYWPFFGGEALKIARLAMAAQQQNLASELYQAIIHFKDSAITLEQAQKLAEALPGIDMPKLLKAAEQPDLVKALKDNFILASKLRLTGTPTIIITDKTGKFIEAISGFNKSLKRDLENRIDLVKKRAQIQNPQTQQQQLETPLLQTPSVQPQMQTQAKAQEAPLKQADNRF